MPIDVPPGTTCVLFDMDGVLVDVSQSYRTAIARTAETFTGRPVGPETIQQFKNRGGFNDDWELTHAIIRDAGVTAEFEDVVRTFQKLYRGSRWDGLITEETPLVSTRLLEELVDAGVDLGVVTGRPNEEAEWTIENFGWMHLFAVVVARAQQKNRPKPDGYPLSQALESLPRDHSPAATIYVGDTVDDMQAAVNAGVIAVGFVPPYLEAGRHGELLRLHGARTVITDYASLFDALGMK